ncbi:uncharacterized protein EV420DRAFT_369023 [Desarmillaria tabescens]|uniref:Secreted protein n=1 Tax=Armillaria tabescens TaxID=1929756 RepID=A0AA39N5G9_ARMTA|nr:uncharacterized protein EV420DRAFT_369023 [Desarmillaria tabescens]KAK0458642.1 hypothetical protein EV420DRAFT_369023 [Desarmillaria tabescens]
MGTIWTLLVSTVCVSPALQHSRALYFGRQRRDFFLFPPSRPVYTDQWISGFDRCIRIHILSFIMYSSSKREHDICVHTDIGERSVNFG